MQRVGIGDALLASGGAIEPAVGAECFVVEVSQGRAQNVNVRPGNNLCTAVSYETDTMPSVYLLHRWTSDRERAPLRTTGRGSGRCLGAAAIASLVALIGAWLPWARVAGPVTGPPPSRAREALRGVDYSPALPSGEQSVNLIATPPTPVGFQFVDLAVILPVFAVLVGVGLALWRGRSSGVVFVLAGVAVFATGLVQFGEVAPLSDYAAGPGLALLGLSGIALVVSGLVLLWGSLDVLAWARERLDIERDERRVDSR